MGSTNPALLVTLVCWASAAVAEEADGPREDEAAAVRRVSATLLGEAIGGGLPLIVGYALIDRSTCNPFSGCSNAPFAIGASIAPFTFAAGATATHAALGGRAGPGFGLAGALTGYVAGLSFLAFVSLAAKNPWSAKMPLAGAGLLTALTLAGGVIGLEWRHRSLLGGSRAWSAGRLALTTLAFWVPAFGLSFGLSYGLAALSPTSPVLVGGLLVGGLGVLVVSALAGWAVHRGLGGKGNPMFLVAGLLASSAAAALFFFSHVWSPPTPKLFGGSDGSAFAPIIGITAAIAMAGPPIALEWNSALQAAEPETKDADTPVNVGLTPIAGGAVLGLGFRF